MGNEKYFKTCVVGCSEFLKPGHLKFEFDCYFNELGFIILTKLSKINTFSAARFAKLE